MAEAFGFLGGGAEGFGIDFEQLRRNFQGQPAFQPGPAQAPPPGAGQTTGAGDAFNVLKGITNTAGNGVSINSAGEMKDLKTGEIFGTASMDELGMHKKGQVSNRIPGLTRKGHGVHISKDGQIVSGASGSGFIDTGAFLSGSPQGQSPGQDQTAPAPEQTTPPPPTTAPPGAGGSLPVNPVRPPTPGIGTDQGTTRDIIRDQITPNPFTFPTAGGLAPAGGGVAPAGPSGPGNDPNLVVGSGMDNAANQGGGPLVGAPTGASGVTEMVLAGGQTPSNPADPNATNPADAQQGFEQLFNPENFEQMITQLNDENTRQELLDMLAENFVPPDPAIFEGTNVVGTGQANFGLAGAPLPSIQQVPGIPQSQFTGFQADPTGNKSVAQQIAEQAQQRGADIFGQPSPSTSDSFGTPSHDPNSVVGNPEVTRDASLGKDRYVDAEGNVYKMNKNGEMISLGYKKPRIGG